MAKILSIHIENVPEYIDYSEDDFDLTVKIEIEYHPLDIKLEMEYCLNLFIYDVHGKMDPPLIVGNWDESFVMQLENSMDLPDDYLGTKSIALKATEKDCTIETVIPIKLGKFGDNVYYNRKVEVFATAIPAVGRASKWSIEHISKVNR